MSGPQVQFEVHVLKGDRWVMEDVGPEEGPILALAKQMTSRKELSAVKVIRETYYPDQDRAVDRVIYRYGDGASQVDHSAFRPPPAPPTKSKPALPPPPPVQRPRQPPPPPGTPWGLIACSSFGMMLAFAVVLMAMN